MILTHARGNLSSEANEYVYARICVTGCRCENPIYTPASKNAHNEKGKKQFMLGPFLWMRRLKWAYQFKDHFKIYIELQCL